MREKNVIKLVNRAQALENTLKGVMSYLSKKGQIDEELLSLILDGLLTAGSQAAVINTVGANDLDEDDYIKNSEPSIVEAHDSLQSDVDTLEARLFFLAKRLNAVDCLRLSRDNLKYINQIIINNEGFHMALDPEQMEWFVTTKDGSGYEKDEDEDEDDSEEN
jgi:hypothetical protein